MTRLIRLLRIASLGRRKIEAKLNHKKPSIFPALANSLVEQYVCNFEPSTEEKIICYPYA